MPAFAADSRRLVPIAAGIACALSALSLSLPNARAQNPATTPAATAPPVATLHPGALRQPIYGFGGSQTYNGDALFDFPNRDLVYQALFQELRLDIWRLRNYDGYPGQQASYEAKLRDFAMAARRWSDPSKRGGKAPVRVMFTAWSPPPALKSNNMVSGRSDGTDKGLENVTLKQDASGKYVYDAYADWWIDSVRNFQKLTSHSERHGFLNLSTRTVPGFLPDYVILQNELDFPASYEGCRFLPSEGTGRDGFAIAGYDKALAAVAGKMQAEFGGMAPKILGPETFSIMLDGGGKSRVEAFVDPATDTGKSDLTQLFGVSYHLYGAGGESRKPEEQERFHKALASVAKAYHTNGVDKPLFQNEYLEGDSMTQVAGMISDTLTIGEASAYLVWIVARDAHKPGYGLVYFHPEDGTIERRERFYAVKHFSYYVGEGWNRIGAELPEETGVKLSAFAKSDGHEMAAILINTSDTEKRVTLTTDAGTPFADPAVKTSLVRSSEGEGGERWLDIGPLKPDHIIVLPKKSIVTVHWQR